MRSKQHWFTINISLSGHKKILRHIGRVKMSEISQPMTLILQPQAWVLTTQAHLRGYWI